MPPVVDCHGSARCAGKRGQRYAPRLCVPPHFISTAVLAPHVTVCVFLRQVSLEMLEQLPPYEELRGLEEKLRFESKLSFDSIFNEPTGYYMIKCTHTPHAHADMHAASAAPASFHFRESLYVSDRNAPRCAFRATSLSTHSCSLFCSFSRDVAISLCLAISGPLLSLQASSSPTTLWIRPSSSRMWRRTNRCVLNPHDAKSPCSSISASWPQMIPLRMNLNQDRRFSKSFSSIRGRRNLWGAW